MRVGLRGVCEANSVSVKRAANECRCGDAVAARLDIVFDLAFDFAFVFVP